MRPLIETKAFPQSLNGEVARVASRLVHEEDHRGSGNFCVQVQGEYVLPIIMLIEAHSRSDDLGLYGEFLARNTQYLKKTERRVMSCGDAYHRHLYPQRAQYPGFLAMTALENAANNAAATIGLDLSTRGANV